jgi:hypothetical protein
MSFLTDFIFTFTKEQSINIGDTINIVSTEYTPNTLFNDTFIVTGSTYSQSEYPELFQKIGLVYQNVVSYNVSTEFYVPKITNYENITFDYNLDDRYVEPKITVYMRAR